MKRLLAIAAVALAVVSVGVVLVQDLMHHGPTRTVLSGWSFGDGTQLYQRGSRVIVSSPYIDNTTNGTVTVTGIHPVTRGCRADFMKPQLLQATANDPYQSALEIPPWDPSSEHLTGNLKMPLVFRHQGGLSAYFGWEFTIPSFCRFTVEGYWVDYKTASGSGSDYLAQQTIFIPTDKSVWGPEPR